MYANESSHVFSFLNEVPKEEWRLRKGLFKTFQSGFDFYLYALGRDGKLHSNIGHTEELREIGLSIVDTNSGEVVGNYEWSAENPGKFSYWPELYLQLCHQVESDDSFVGSNDREYLIDPLKKKLASLIS